MIARKITCPHLPAMGRRFFARRSERNIIIIMAVARARERKSVLEADTTGTPAPASSLLFLEMSKSTPMPLHLLTPGLVIIRRPLIASLGCTTNNEVIYRSRTRQSV